MPLLHACTHFGILPHEMLLIGDSLNDAEAARAAGCHVFCVPYGYNEGRDVRELDCDAIVTSVYRCYETDPEIVMIRKNTGIEEYVIKAWRPWRPGLDRWRACTRTLPYFFLFPFFVESNHDRN